MSANIRRVRRTAPQWRELLAEHARSGVGVGQFCREQGLAPSSLRNWKRKLEAIDASARAGAGFIELTVPTHAPEREDWDVELELGAGMVLRLRRR